MEALDLLLRSFISENKSMDEMCFLLQVRGGWHRVQSSGHPLPTSILALASRRSTRGGSLVRRSGKRARLAGVPHAADPSAPGAVPLL